MLGVGSVSDACRVVSCRDNSFYSIPAALWVMSRYADCVDTEVGEAMFRLAVPLLTAPDLDLSRNIVHLASAQCIRWVWSRWSPCCTAGCLIVLTHACSCRSVVEQHFSSDTLEPHLGPLLDGLQALVDESPRVACDVLTAVIPAGGYELMSSGDRVVDRAGKRTKNTTIGVANISSTHL
jgi:hypothetical protein